MVASESPWERVSSLMQEVARGELDRWPELAAALDPLIEPMVRGQAIGRLRTQPDAVRDIVVRVLEKLYAKEQSIVRELATDRPRSLEAWMRVMVKRTAIDYMRAQPEFDRGGPDREPDWVSLVTLATGAGEGPVSSVAAKRGEVLAELIAAIDAAERAGAAGEGEVARLAMQWGVSQRTVTRLIKRAGRFRSVIERLFQGFSYREIAEQLALSPREVELTVEHVRELLQARFRTVS